MIELYLRVETGRAGELVGKYDEDGGYRLTVDEDGGIRFSLEAEEAVAELAEPGVLADGEWRHLIVEADRSQSVLRCYVDGSLVSTAPCKLPTGASLANPSDFRVGDGLHGAIDFLRVSRCTLADARTTIEELYAWQFDGPHLRDFTGRDPTGAGRDAGAIESNE